MTLIDMIDDTERRVPGFYLMPVRETWLRRHVVYDWFGLPVGVVRSWLANGVPA